MKPKLLISFSGGRTSAYMTKILLDHYSDIYEIIVVYANTGKEREETLEFINECDIKFNFNTIWIEAITNTVYGKGVTAKIVNYKTASRNGKPFEEMIKKHGIPSVASPHCTRELKKYAIKAFARSIEWKDYQTAIGIRVDEIDGISPKAKEQKLIYPLISYQHGVRKNDINKFWHEQSFDLKLKTYQGNCDLCFKKSFRKLMTIAKENPELCIWWKEMDDKYENFIPNGKKNNPKLFPPIHFFRTNKSTRDIIDMAKNDFITAIDESKYKQEYEQLQLFGIDLDISNGCTESCEVF